MRRGFIVAALLVMGCRPAAVPSPKSTPVAVAPAVAQPVKEQDPEPIPVGSPIKIKGNVWGFSNPFVFERLKTFITASDRKGWLGIIDSGQACQLNDGTHARLISYPSSRFIEVRIVSGEQNGHLWLVEASVVEDNRTTPDDLE